MIDVARAEAEGKEYWKRLRWCVFMMHSLANSDTKSKSRLGAVIGLSGRDLFYALRTFDNIAPEWIARTDCELLSNLISYAPASGNLYQPLEKQHNAYLNS